jgi:peptide/nickel transport system permease protein
MRNYIIKRLLLFIPTILGVSVLVFGALRILPGDVAELILTGGDPDVVVTEDMKAELREETGLDKPIHVQYLDWIWGVARFDLGNSWNTNRPITRNLKRQFPVTLQLAVASLILVVLIALPIGMLAALYQDKWPDYLLRGTAVLASAMPGFFAAILIVLILAAGFGWLPPLRFYNLWERPWDSMTQLFFPAVALGLLGTATLLRMTRAQMLEVLREDYVRTARAKGLTERVVVTRHSMRNALIPVVTVIGFQVAVLLGGTVVIEVIFSLPGMGEQLVRAVLLRDFPVVQTYVLYLVLISLLVNLIVDISYAWLDPRIRYA